VIDGLKKVSKKSKLFFICGNRDYLIDKQFSKKTNVTLLPDHELIKLGKEFAIILMVILYVPMIKNIRDLENSQDAG